MVSDLRAEHLATRQRAGLFDFSFMGLYEFDGRAPRSQALQSRDLARLARRAASPTPCCSKRTAASSTTPPCGGWTRDRWWLFSGRRSDAAWIAERATPRVRSGEHAVIALQGPASGAILARLAGEAAVAIAPLLRACPRCASRRPTGHIGRIGYSGELGYEIVVAAEQDAAPCAEALLEAGREHGLRECGFDDRRHPAHRGGLRAVRPRDHRPRAARGARPRAPGGAARAARGRSRAAGWSASRSSRRPGPRARARGCPARARRANAIPRCSVAGWRSVTSTRPMRRRARQVALEDGRCARVARLPFYDPMRRRPRATPL